MTASSIPSPSATLTLEQMREMEQRQIKKHHVAIILLHWFNAIVWLIELATGLALVSNPSFQVAPDWYVSTLRSALEPANLLRIHIATGITWMVVFVVYGVFGYKEYLHHEVLIREMGLDRDDIDWLRIRTLRLLGKSNEPLPPQGVYNAGQKLFAFLVYSALPVIAFTGLIMTFHWFGSAVVAWSMVLHFLAVGMVVSGLMIHVYMGAVFPEERSAFFSMITGMVNELYTYNHHHKWWREISEARREWEESVVEPVKGAEKSQNS